MCHVGALPRDEGTHFVVLSNQFGGFSSSIYSWRTLLEFSVFSSLGIGSGVRVCVVLAYVLVMIDRSNQMQQHPLYFLSYIDWVPWMSEERASHIRLSNGGCKHNIQRATIETWYLSNVRSLISARRRLIVTLFR